MQPCPGYDLMPLVCRNAPADLRSHLWTLYWLVRTLGGKVVELGVRNGDSTRAICAAARDLGEIRRSHKGIRVVSFDVEDVGAHVPRHSRAMGFAWVEWLWDFRHGDSVQAGKAWKEGPLDLVFVDTDHTYATTLSEINAWSPHVRPGGALAFHDVGLTDPPRDGVRPAILKFLETNDYWNYEEHLHIDEGDAGFGILWRIA